MSNSTHPDPTSPEPNGPGSTQPEPSRPGPARCGPTPHASSNAASSNAATSNEATTRAEARPIQEDDAAAADAALPVPERIRRIALELAANAQTGLAYCDNQFDAQRLHRIGELAGDLMQLVADGPLPPYRPEVVAAGGYATPKVAVRGAVFDERGRVLLVRETLDEGGWTLPGGWCDVLDTPTGAVEREVREEAGVRVRVSNLAAVVDREAWGHVPPYDVHVFTLFFLCDALEPVDLGYTSDETAGVGWFDVGDLPDLSLRRILPEQIRMMHQHWAAPGPAYVD